MAVYRIELLLPRSYAISGCVLPLLPLIHCSTQGRHWLRAFPRTVGRCQSIVFQSTFQGCRLDFQQELEWFNASLPGLTLAHRGLIDRPLRNACVVA